ncbi:hypothetical protein KG892_01295 [Vermiphilus pyriformis]|nr:MAG: hypothetical protein KG892_01295 [Vermiphilus pyriformis]
MTQLMHFLIALILSNISWQVFFKKFFLKEEEVDRWEKYYQKKFFDM